MKGSQLQSRGLVESKASQKEKKFEKGRLDRLCWTSAGLGEQKGEEKEGALPSCSPLTLLYEDVALFWALTPSRLQSRRSLGSALEVKAFS